MLGQIIVLLVLCTLTAWCAQIQAKRHRIDRVTLVTMLLSTALIMFGMHHIEAPWSSHESTFGVLASLATATPLIFAPVSLRIGFRVTNSAARAQRQMMHLFLASAAFGTGLTSAMATASHVNEVTSLCAIYAGGLALGIGHSRLHKNEATGPLG